MFHGSSLCLKHSRVTQGAELSSEDTQNFLRMTGEPQQFLELGSRWPAEEAKRNRRMQERFLSIAEQLIGLQDRGTGGASSRRYTTIVALVIVGI